MNLQSDVPGRADGVAAGLLATLLEPKSVVTPLEYRSLGDEEAGLPGPELLERRHGDRRAPLGAVQGVETAEARATAEAALAAARAEAFERGVQEGRARLWVEMETECHASVLRERERIAGVVAEFGGAKATYFAQIEQEVVRLALAIAARVLHRETQMDALVLAGAVRVAIEQMADRSGMILRTAKADCEAWTKMFLALDADARPKVVGEAKLGRGECVLETTMGTVELGVSTQLEEIERGFFDLLSCSPASRAGQAAQGTRQ